MKNVKDLRSITRMGEKDYEGDLGDKYLEDQKSAKKDFIRLDVQANPEMIIEKHS